MAATAEKEPPTVATVPQAATVAGAEPGLSRAGAANSQTKNNQPDEIHYVNPFVHKLVWDDPVDKAKTALLTVILLPFRVVLILVCLVVAWALANIGLYGLSKEDLRNKPLAGWRRQLRQLTALVMRALFLFGSFNYIRYKGVRASPKEAPVICVAPHTAFYDSVCVVLFGPSAVVAKYETASLPFFGTIPVDGAAVFPTEKEDRLAGLLRWTSNFSTFAWTLVRCLKRPLGEFATLAYTCAGLGITIRGRQASRTEAPVLVVSPHSSFLDAVIIYLTGLSSPLVRNADRNLGKLIDYAQPIYVCREDPHSRQTTIREIIQRANSKEDWPQILIFPEGTCTNRTSLIKFKPGAFYPAVPIQPVLMRYPNKVDTVTWTWEGPNAIQLLWRTLTQFHTFCEIEFMPVYYPNEAEKANPKLYADNVRMMMAKALDIPISDYTFDDCKLMTFVKNVGMPHPAAIADIEKLRETLRIDVADRERKIVTSQREFTDANSFLTYAQFTTQMQIDPAQEAAQNLFHKLYRPESPDVIDFREYLLLALFLVTLYKPKLSFVESLFHLYGVGGRVDRNQLHDTLKYLVRITRKEVNSIFLQADLDNLGTIDFNQFQKAIEHSPLLAKLQKNNDPNNLRLG